MNRGAVAAVLVAVLVTALVVLRPHATSRVVSFGTPVPEPVAELSFFRLPPRTAACLHAVALEPGRQVAHFRVDTGGRPGPALRFTISGASYEQAQVVAPDYGA